METKIIQKYNGKTIPQLIKLAEKHFNKFIRERDEGCICISCDSHNTSDASHFYSGGHHAGLRFNEKNVHLSCAKCNRFLHGNLNEYRKRLPDRIGQSELDKLDELASRYKRTGFKWDRITLISIIETYKQKNKSCK